MRRILIAASGLAGAGAVVGRLIVRWIGRTPTPTRSHQSAGGVSGAANGARPDPSMTSGAEKTRRELYAEAQALGVPGRSKMNKAQLARAVARSATHRSGRG
jgi:hypothetical protein